MRRSGETGGADRASADLAFGSAGGPEVGFPGVYRARPGEGSRREVVNVLAALAFGFGRGLPSRTWVQCATVLAGEPAILSAS